MTAPTPAEVAAAVEAHKAGIAYAETLKVGDIFRGSHGEADDRGLTGLERQCFGTGALMVIRGLDIWTDAEGRISKLQPRGYGR